MNTYKVVLEVSGKPQDQFPEQFSLTYTDVTRMNSVGTIEVNDLTTKVLKRFDYWIGKYKLDEQNDLQLVGEYLYNILLPHGSAVRKRFEAEYDLTRTQKNRMLLTLVSRERAEELAKYPWEFLYMPARQKPQREGFFLAGQHSDLILTRFVPDMDREFERAKQLRILIVFSHPYIPGYSDLDTPDTRNAIKAIRDLAKGDELVQVKEVENPTWEELDKALNQPRKSSGLTGLDRKRAVVKMLNCDAGFSTAACVRPVFSCTQRTTRREPRVSSYAASFSSFVPKYISSGVRYSRL